MTNFEKIKQMSAEEFAKRRHALESSSCEQNKNGCDPMECKKNKWMNGLAPCDICFLNWLESEAEE